MFKCLMSSAFCVVLSANLLAGQPDLRARDQAYTQGKISYTYNNIAGTQWSRPETLVFSRDSRFRHDIGAVKGASNQVSNLIFVKGRDYRYTERKVGKEVVVTFDNNSWPLNDHPWFFITAKPNFPLALGL